MLMNSKTTIALEKLLRCPQSGERLRFDGNELVSENGLYRYPISPSGIPLFMGQYWGKESIAQQKHYDQVAKAYTTNLTYTHTQEYFKALDEAMLDVIKHGDLMTIAEICCGHGESYFLLDGRFTFGLGVDVSQAMLEAGRQSITDERYHFIQGDATCLPIEDNVIDNVIMLGGIHHVNDRHQLFSEVYRILKPGGTFYWREPVNDLFIWRWLRFLIYKLSPSLDFDTERPLRYQETKTQLEQTGFALEEWRTGGFVGFMLFMNSDVLFFNRLFHYVPGIASITRLFVKFDRWIISLPGMSKFGLQVFGRASKPDSDSSMVKHG